MTNIEMQFFRGREDYTSMVNVALKDEHDVALQAEVYWYRASQQKIADTAQAVVHAHQALHKKQRVASHSAQRLSEANMYNRLYPQVV
jgi:hypothetical protein